MRFDEYCKLEKQRRIKRYEEEVEKTQSLELDSLNERLSNLINQSDKLQDNLSKEKESLSSDEVEIKTQYGEYVIEKKKVK